MKNPSGKADMALKRPPIVVILGHVDHGKTTLLDYIRKTNVAQKEAGGITQKIGASVIETSEGKKITFIDTPGHAAFANMRSRGVNIADIAILVVAASEGVKPQTKEALEYILNSRVPFIVAATKMDIPGASLDLVSGQLQKEGVLFEGKGGDIPLVAVSAKTGEGVDKLLELISLLAELNDIKGDPDLPLEANVIETSKEKGGLTVTAVVKNGKLTVGENVITQTAEGKVKSLIDDKGVSVKSVLPGMPAVILGFNKLPLAGDRIWNKSEKDLLPVEAKKSETALTGPAEEGKLTLLIKTDSSGSLEAVLASLPKDVSVVYPSVGEVNESDVFLAKSSHALIFAFESKVSASILKLADAESVIIERFDVIYRLFERVEEILQSGIIEILGTAEIIASFPFDGKKIAGCRVKSGRIGKKDFVVLKRGENELGDLKIISIKKAKQEVDEVKQGEECGILFSPQLDFKLSDMLISLRK